MRTLFAIAIFFLLFPSATFAAVTINEVLPKPSNEASEWIELFNNGSDAVSLEGWKLENTNGTKHTYTIPNGFTVEPGKFRTFTQAQSGINLYNEGDTVRLLDNGNTLVDSQSYPSILGYETSMGRSTNGGGTWAICTSWTESLPNKCPVPTSTPTPIPPAPTFTPTQTPTLTPTPTKIPSFVASVATLTPTPANTDFFTTANQPAQSQVLGVDSKQKSDSRGKIIGLMGFAVAALSLLGLIARWYKNHNPHN